MTVIEVWDGNTSRLLRKAKHLSTREFADQVKVKFRTVERWESQGSAAGMQPPTQRIFEQMRADLLPWEKERFERFLTEHLSKENKPPCLESTGEYASTLALESNEKGERMQRRVMLEALSTLALGPGPALATLEALRQGLELAVGVGSERSIAEWDAVAHGYSCEFFATPATEIVGDVAADLHVLMRMIDARTSDSVGRDLSRSAAQLSVILAMGLSDLGQSRAARRWWSTARHAAASSTDAATRMWVHDWEAINGLNEKRPLSTITDLIDEGIAFGSTNCSGRAGLLAARAQALAVQGRPREALEALRAVEASTDTMPSAILADAGSMHGWPEFRLLHTASYVQTHLAMTDTNHVNAAMAAQDAAIKMYPAELRVELAWLEMHRATCLVLKGDLDDGVRYALTTLDELPAGLHGAALRQIASNVVEAVPPVERTRSVVRELQQRLQPPMPSLA